jgi:hypothetical protein
MSTVNDTLKLRWRVKFCIENKDIKIKTLALKGASVRGAKS